MLRSRITTSRFIPVAGMVALVGGVGAGNESIDDDTAIKVKAAYLYNFAKYVTWPDEAFEDEKAPIVIGIVGNSRMAAHLERVIRSKTVAGRPLSVRRIDGGSRSDETWKDCHVLFIDSAEYERLADILERLRSADVLVVGEGDAFARSGGMIALVLSGENIVFHINRTALEETELKVSAKLLRLARKVHS